MKKYIIIVLDIIIAVYLAFAVTAFNNPEHVVKKCTKVNISITDESTYGFLNTKEIKSILEKKGLYPLEKDLSTVSPRQIEEMLCNTPFVNTAQCCKTHDGHVLITVTQRSPLVRIKSIRNEDYYIDENGGIMPNSKYISDLIVVTGYVSKSFAQRYISILAGYVMKNDLWRNQIEQIHVRKDFGIEIVPRVGDHIVFLGNLPLSNDAKERREEVVNYVSDKLERLRKFYVHGLDSVGWNKYESIDLRYSNQIICKKRPEFCVKKETPMVREVHEADHPEVEAQAASEHSNVATNDGERAVPTVVVNKETDRKESENKSVKKEAPKKETPKKETSKKEPAKKDTSKKEPVKKDTQKKKETNKKN